MKRFLLLPLLALPSVALAQDAKPADLSKLKAEQLCGQLCSGCHGADLSGGQGGSLIDGEWKHGSSDADLMRSIKEGNPQLGMTPFGTLLDDGQLRMMVIFIREKEKQAKEKGMSFPKPKPGEVTKTQQENYKIEMVVENGLKDPWALAFLPDGRKLVTEKSGRLRLIEADGSLNPEPVKDTPQVVEHGQGGLMEVAVHPDYEKNGWIYLGFADGAKEGKQVKTITAYVRGKIKDGQWVEQQQIFKAEPQYYTDAGVHFGTRLVFDGKGFIYFIVGERGGRMEVQDVANPKGKIYRLRDDGTVPDDNPKFDKAPVPGVWTYGHRNPQGLDIDPRDGSIYNTEHGPRGGDELNWVLPGHNYGWPVITYGMDYDGSPISDKTAQEGMDQPVTYWQPSIATCGLAFYRGDKFPKWKNDLLVGALAQQEIRRLRLVDHKVTEQEVVLKGIGRVRDIKSAKDGNIYVILNGPDRVIRLVPAE
ncbi:PQQ-dependent sugar dehydrogenase [Haloferula sp. BvORR071]|uniref:PQQ-dependent sugar dehydrogenase n=1 Tax=Haloferula sp. BvORR071 TaxID=1396141 RepID=UPI0005511AE4|nr:PQQ-dependent sugar dehydrogenase [Haloferula sp. BvORR071]